MERKLREQHLTRPMNDHRDAQDVTSARGEPDAVERTPATRWLFLGAAAIAIATDVWYLLAIGEQRPEVTSKDPRFRVLEIAIRERFSPYDARVIAYASAIGLAAAALTFAAFVRGYLTLPFASAGITFLLVLGILGVMSIGLPLIVAGALAIAALATLSRSEKVRDMKATMAGIAVAIVTVAAILVLT